MNKSESSNITTVFFSCVGREHLLVKAIEGFEAHNQTSIRECILAFDGPMERAFNPSQLAIDRLVNNCERQGYVQSIRNALALINTDYFFWQEDDCFFLRDIEMERLKQELESNAHWVQVGWGIGTKFPDYEKTFPIGRDNMFRTAYGFSARPSLCRTSDIRSAFATIGEDEEISKAQGFETWLREWLAKQSKISVSLDPGDNPVYLHAGEIESTSRQYHCVGQGTGDVESYMASIDANRMPALSYRVKMIPKLAYSFISLCTQQLLDKGI